MPRYIDADALWKELSEKHSFLLDKQLQGAADGVIHSMNIVQCAPTVNTGITPERVKEICDAERDGRCVVLPCKPGTTVFRVVNDAEPHVTQDKCYGFKQDEICQTAQLIGREVLMEEFGKTVFLTPKEANAALTRNDDTKEVEK